MSTETPILFLRPLRALVPFVFLFVLLSFMLFAFMQSHDCENKP